jgi:hypothetical protein
MTGRYGQTVVIVVALFDQPYQRPFHSGRDIHSTTLVISGGEGGMIGATNMAWLWRSVDGLKRETPFGKSYLTNT